MPWVTPVWRYFSSQKHFFIMPDFMLNWTLSKCQSPVYWQVHPKVPVHLLSCFHLHLTSVKVWCFQIREKNSENKIWPIGLLIQMGSLRKEYSHLLQGCQFCGIVQARQSNLSSPMEVWLKVDGIDGIWRHKLQGKKEHNHLGSLRYLSVQPSSSRQLDQILSLGQQLTSPSNYSDCTTLQNQC